MLTLYSHLFAVRDITGIEFDKLLAARLNRVSMSMLESEDMGCVGSHHYRHGEHMVQTRNTARFVFSFLCLVTTMPVQFRGSVDMYAIPEQFSTFPYWIRTSHWPSVIIVNARYAPYESYYSGTVLLHASYCMSVQVDHPTFAQQTNINALIFRFVNLASLLILV